MKNYIYQSRFLFTFGIVLTSFCLHAVPIVQTFYLPFPENQVFNTLLTIYSGPAFCGGGGTTPASPIRTYVSISPYVNNTIIYYDHWEDGYETEISNPTQATTQVWGDNNPANGIPPGFGTDIINAGAGILLQNNVNPLNLLLIDYDGRDKIGVSKTVAISKLNWATGVETLMASALSVYATQDWGTEHIIPTGENVMTGTQMFQYTGFSVMARFDGTLVNIDADRNGTFETVVTLNEGQTYHKNGAVSVGGRIQSSQPVQVTVVTGDRCDTYENRWFSLPPLVRWGSNYLGPLSGTDKLYLLYNPQAVTITIKVRSRTGALADITIPSNGTAPLAGIVNSGYRFYTVDGQKFGVLGLSDASNALNTANRTFDWGTFLLPMNELTQQVIAGWSPGHDPNVASTENSSPIWITASEANSTTVGNTTKICVDYDGDDIGPFTASTGRKYDVELNLASLQSFKIYDPDGDQTNTVIFVCDNSSDLISTVWGEDAATASAGTPGLDMGSGLPGIYPFVASKTGNLFTDINGNGLYNIGDVVRFTIAIGNQSLIQFNGVYNVQDLLPTWVTYIPNTTQVSSTVGGVVSVPDSGTTPFPLDQGGANISITLNPQEDGLITFRATVNAKPPGDGCMTNYATVSKDGIVYEPDWSFCVIQPLEICGNGIDDDGNGLIDCYDPACFVTSAGGGQFCLAANINLTASGGTSYSWQGPGGFVSTLQNPVRSSATYAMSGTYSVTITGGGCSVILTVEVDVANCSPVAVPCEAATCAGPNLFGAGTFEGFSVGAPGFTTDFTNVICGTASTSYYSVVTNANTCNSIWTAAPDHTIGNGNGLYLAANYAAAAGANLNGNATTGEIVRSFAIPVLPNTNYCFSAWFLKLCASCVGQPDFRFLVNNVIIGNVAGSTISTSAWLKRGFSFNTTDFGNPNTITIAIVQNSFGILGFDLAIDDIELRQLFAGTNPTAVNDIATICAYTPQIINVLANDAGYTASTLTIVSQPPPSAGTVSISGTNILFTPVPDFIGQVSFSYSVCAALNSCCATATVTVNIEPVTPMATGPATLCAGADLPLSASGGNTYSWTGPSGFTASTPLTTINNVTLAASGTYTVNISNSYGCTGVANVPVSVQSCTLNRDPECNCN